MKRSDFKQKFQNLQIGQKVFAIILIAAIISLITATLAVIVYDASTFRPRFLEDLQTKSKIIRLSLHAPLNFYDQQAAVETLATLENLHQIQKAIVYDLDGSVFASYIHSTQENLTVPATPAKHGYQFDVGKLSLSEAIIHENETIGTLYFESSLPPLYARLPQYGIMVSVVLLALLVVSLLLFILLKRNIFTPIESLMNVAKDVIANDQYDIRADKYSEDEIGELTDAINKMLSTIELREHELIKYQDHLEELVNERTKELESAQKELIKKERLAILGQLTAMVSHELRNPLAVLRNTFFTLTQSINLNDLDGREKIKRIERNIVRCDKIINELLDFTNIRTLNQEDIVLEEWLLDVFDNQIIPKEITIEYDFNLNKKTVLFDPELLERAVINIYENACHALKVQTKDNADKNDLKIIINTCNENDRIELVILDNGEGIASHILPNIFEPLYSTKTYGVGLGLPIVEHIMKRHSGGIEIESKAGEGTQVILWLPISLMKEVDLIENKDRCA